MSDDNIDVKERYDKLVFNLSQFVSKPIKDFPSIKSEFLNILKTHRPVRVVDYQYGLSNSLKQRTQLIIHECNERAKVREYFKVGRTNVWKCCECRRTSSSSSDESDTTDLILAHGIVFVKIGHDCMPRQLSFVQQIQKFYKEKNIEEAVALQKSVLGSEDLNVSVDKKTSTGKRGTKVAKVLVSESTLQYFLELGVNIKDFEPSNMDELTEEIQEKLSPEDSFANIIENSEKYSTEKKEVILSNKSKLLSILKSHNPIKVGNYEFGLSEHLQPNKRLNVFEWNDRKRIREYSERPGKHNSWTCRECFRISERVSNRGIVNTFPALFFVSGIVLVPNEHSCKPMNYLLAMHHQKLLHEGNVQGARRMRQKINFVYGECNFANIVNVLDETVSTSLPENSTLTENRKEVNDNESNSKKIANLKREIESYNENDLVKSKSKKKNDVDEEIYLSVQRDFDVEMKDAESSTVATASIFSFQKHSTLILNEICAKLKIEYRNRAEKLWKQIMFSKIGTVTAPEKILIHHLKTKNFYEILSKFFTGKINQHEQIKATINEEFRNKMVSSEKLSVKKFNKKYLDTVTDQHLSFIAKFIPCRILIFDGAEIRKYGKWKSTSNKRATLVVALIDGCYSIVLDF